MAEDHNREEFVLIWARKLSSLLVGWNIFILVFLLLAIGFRIILSWLGLDEGSENISGYLILLISALVIAGFLSLKAAMYVGEKSLAWVKQKNPGVVYTFFCLLLIMTYLFFPRPAPFTYTVF